MNYFTSEALLSLRPGAQFSIVNEDYSTLQWSDDNDLAPPTEEEIIIEAERLQREWVKNNYQRLRKPEYPSIQDQLDLLYHKGYDGWKEEINKVKEKYPKPEGL